MVHGPGPEKGSMEPWSMFCPYPSSRRTVGNIHKLEKKKSFLHAEECLFFNRLAL